MHFISGLLFFLRSILLIGEIDMDAHKALIQNIFNNGTLIEVPFFQRSYVWKEELWQRLLDDMEFIIYS